MGCGSSVPVENDAMSQPKPIDDIVVRVTDDGLGQHVVNDDSAPDSIKACKLWGETLIQDLSDNTEMTGFSSIDKVFVQASDAISQASMSVNTVCLLRERIMAVGAGVAGAPVLEVGIVGSSPIVSVVSLAGQTKQVLATVSVDGGKRIADVSRLVDALKTVVAKAGQSLAFKVTASFWVSLVGHEGELKAPPVSVMETKDGVDLGLVSVADIKERLRKRLIAKGVLQEGEPLDDDDDDELDEADMAAMDNATAAPDEADAAPDEGKRPGLMSVGAGLMSRTADALGAAKESAIAAADKAKEHAAGLAKKASKLKAYLADAKERMLSYEEAQLLLKLRSKQTKEDKKILEHARSCAAELFALNTALFVLARQLRVPVVGANYGFEAGARQLRACLDDEAERQIGAKVVFEQRIDMDACIRLHTCLPACLRTYIHTHITMHA